MREMTAVDRPWSDYPLGTLAHALGGGAWLRVEHGWQWNGHSPHPGSTFPTPSADAVLVTLPDAAEFDADRAWREFMLLLDEAGERGLRVRFWSCPLHPGPVTPMTTVCWDGDEATCALCGYTRSEHRQRLKAATSAAGQAGLVGMNDPRATPKPPA
jgi:hypothetical protein